MNKAKWLVYTVLLGLMPAAARVIVWYVVSPSRSAIALAAADVATYSMVLVATNVSALEHEVRVDRKWKTLQIGISMFAGALMAVVFALDTLTRVSEILSSTRILYAAMFLALATTWQSYTIWDRLDKYLEAF